MKRVATIAVVGLLSCGVFWFLAVDRSWFQDDCPTCMFHRDSIQDRLFGIVVHERIDEDPTLLQLVAVDLGLNVSTPR